MINPLEKIVSELIMQKKEGSYWDFKECWHKDKADLLHDIICLANSLQYEGSRYLIFGVSDVAIVKGVESDQNRKKQSDLLDWLSQIQFAGDIRPEFELRVVTIEDHSIDVLVISDLKWKPYFLSKKYEISGRTLSAGAIYTRLGDKNTAIDRTADLYHVERMWRQRFGINLSPLERLRIILFDVHNWQSDGVSQAYYKLAPEFTLEYGSQDDVVEERWWGNFLGEVTKKFDIIFKYHTTTLKTISCCQFAREALIIPYPEVDYVRIDSSKQKDAHNTYSLFYFLEDTFEFALLCYLFGSKPSGITNEENRQGLLKKNAIASQVKPSIKSLPFMVFKNMENKDAFIKDIEIHITDFFRQKSFTPTMKLGSQKLQEEESFAYWVYDLYFKDKIIETL